MEQTESIENLSLEELTGKLAALSPTQWSKYEALPEDRTEHGGWAEYSVTFGGKLITIGKKKPETYNFKAISPDNFEVVDFEIAVPSGTYRLGVDRSKWHEEKLDNDVLKENRKGIGEIFERVNRELKGYE